MRNTGSVVALLVAAAPWGALLLRNDEPSPTLPAKPFNYADLGLPAHFTGKGFFDANKMDNSPRDNLVTDEGATLGRVLFYDKRLSKNDTIACASCHQQKYAFSDPEQFSTGFEGKKTTRHSMPLVDVRYRQGGAMFWDQRAKTLEVQALMPIENPIEMGMTLDEVVAKVQRTPFYPPLFEAAFGSSQVTSDRISKALSQFVRSIVSYRSKFDSALEQGLDKVLTPQEKLGYDLFYGRLTPGDAEGVFRTGRLGNATCANCHRGIVQSGELRNNGLDPDRSKDPGAVGHFKSPSLRNVASRTRFMHDGRFTSLREVVDHYDSGIVASPDLDGILRTRSGPLRLNMTEEEKEALVAFLMTLTDEALLTDVRFSDPFVKR